MSYRGILGNMPPEEAGAAKKPADFLEVPRSWHLPNGTNFLWIREDTIRGDQEAEELELLGCKSTLVQI